MTVSHPSPVISAPDVDSACAAVRARGLRLTTPRRLVIEALFRAGGPVTAQAIAEGPGGSARGMDVAAVYRNLEVLERIGLARHVHAGHGPGLYTLSDRVESEYLQCERCGQLRAVEPAVLAGARKEITSATGFEARFSHFPLTGICPDCVSAEHQPEDG